mgnify:CR=1 FL=1
MSRSASRLLLLILLAVTLLSGTACRSTAEAASALTPSPADVPTGTPAPLPTATPNPPPTATATCRPTGIPTDINPLTGLRVDNPAVLRRSPLLIKISNESPEVRPQSGLSFADHVWEYQMEGWAQTRYTAVFYSRSPERAGSVRSVRLIDVEELLPMYDALLVYSGASSGMWNIILNAPWLDRTFKEDEAHLYTVRDQNIPRPGTNYYHSLFALPDKVWEEAEERGVSQTPDLGHILFDEQPAPGGIPTTEAAIDYPGLGPKHTWRYDPASGRWLSSTEDQRMRLPDTPDLDFLTGEQLAFDNVIILYAEHYLADFIEDEPNQLLSVGIILTGEGDAVLLRDGLRYECRWQREQPGDQIRLIGPDGEEIPWKPGTTWFNVASTNQYAPQVTFVP